MLFIQQGDIDHSLYIVIRGGFRMIVKQSERSEQTVLEVGQGESVAESALLRRAERLITIYPIRDAVSFLIGSRLS